MSSHRDIGVDRELFWWVLAAFVGLCIIALAYPEINRHYRQRTPIGIDSMEIYEPPLDWGLIHHVVLAEAASEPSQCMRWVACTMKARQWRMNGYNGGRRRDLEMFAQRQPARVVENARVAVQEVRTGHFLCPGQPTHFESTDFPTPYWAVGRKPIVVCGKTRFWRIN